MYRKGLYFTQIGGANTHQRRCRNLFRAMPCAVQYTSDEWINSGQLASTISRKVGKWSLETLRIFFCHPFGSSLNKVCIYSLLSLLLEEIRQEFEPCKRLSSALLYLFCVEVSITLIKRRIPAQALWYCTHGMRQTCFVYRREKGNGEVVHLYQDLEWKLIDLRLVHAQGSKTPLLSPGEHIYTSFLGGIIHFQSPIQRDLIVYRRSL